MDDIPDVELPRFASDEQAQQQVDDDMAALAARVEAVRGQRDEAMRATGSATSRDGNVRVTVDATGVLSDLTLTPGAITATTSDKLARTILATAQQAAAAARAAMQQAVDGIRAGDPTISAAREGARALLGGNVTLPPVPRTAEDPAPDQWPARERRAASPPPDDDQSFEHRRWGVDPHGPV